MKDSIERALNSHDANILTRVLIDLWLRYVTLRWGFWFAALSALVGWGVALYLGVWR